MQPTVTVQPSYRYPFEGYTEKIIEDGLVIGIAKPKTTPTPTEVIDATLQELHLTKDDVLADLGCGRDARVLIAASTRYGCRGIGIEIDRARAADARKAVQDAGLSHLIDIRHGNAALVDPSFYRTVTAAYFFLEPDTIRIILPRLPASCRVASFSHPLPEANHLISVGSKGRQLVFFRIP